MKKLYPYYYQANEDSEPEFIGYCFSWDEAVDILGSEHIHGMSVVDICDDWMMDEFYKYGELEGEDLERYLAERGKK